LGIWNDSHKLVKEVYLLINRSAFELEIQLILCVDLDNQETYNTIE